MTQPCLQCGSHRVVYGSHGVLLPASPLVLPDVHLEGLNC